MANAGQNKREKQKFPEAPADFSLAASRHGETLEMIRKTRAYRNLAFPLLCDPGSLVARQWFTERTPRVFLMDPQRTLIYILPKAL